jgi:radical SAM superfamily enzyme YgiQ (UPF0313 family)
MSLKLKHETIKEKIQTILPRVTKPARYTGGEWNEIQKDPASVDVRFALAFPDVYEVGMSNLGLRILYHILNKRSDTACERTFAPASDMEDEMRRESLPLFTLESHSGVNTFDIVGFSLAYEMTYTNVLNMLDLSGIPVLASDRGNDDPLVVAGGHCAYNPEPMADFIDAFVIGEGEEVVGQLVDTVKENRGDRKALLLALAKVPGVYVPSLYNPVYNEDGTIQAVEPIASDVPASVKKLVVADFENVDFPDKLIVPFIETVHERVALEVM